MGGQLLEHPVEGAHVGESAVIGDIHNPTRGIVQPVDCLLHPDHLHIRDEVYAGILLEKPGEMAVAETHPCRRLAQGDWLAVILVDVIEQLLEVIQHVMTTAAGFDGAGFLQKPADSIPEFPQKAFDQLFVKRFFFAQFRRYPVKKSEHQLVQSRLFQVFRPDKRIGKVGVLIMRADEVRIKNNEFQAVFHLIRIAVMDVAAVAKDKISFPGGKRMVRYVNPGGTGTNQDKLNLFVPMRPKTHIVVRGMPGHKVPVVFPYLMERLHRQHPFLTKTAL